VSDIRRGDDDAEVVVVVVAVVVAAAMIVMTVVVVVVVVVVVDCCDDDVLSRTTQLSCRFCRRAVTCRACGGGALLAPAATVVIDGAVILVGAVAPVPFSAARPPANLRRRW